jgi:NADP-dependent aldehyde dehydrogenase
LIAGVTAQPGTGNRFYAHNPVDGESIEPAFFSASTDDVDTAVSAAQEAANYLAQISGADRARLLCAIADGIDSAAESLIERAMLETALPRPRLTGEVARTSGQLRLFAQVAEEGSWLNARIDTADPNRTPAKPDIRSMLRPLGPVVVFGASNFPLAFSVAGGDTASALAAGNPVIVKAHPAHPGTSELVGQIIAGAIEETRFPLGTFSLLFDSDYEVGAALVQHPGVRAVGFTGSFRGGRALMDLAAQRAEPIPVFAEMGSTNPVFVLPGALTERSEALATGLFLSFTLGAGQFCTKPGLVFAEGNYDSTFSQKLRISVASSGSFSLLTEGIARQFQTQVDNRLSLLKTVGAERSLGNSAQAALFEASGSDYLADQRLSEEVFGPTTLLVHCDSREQMIEAAHALEGHLTATILGTEKDLAENAELLSVLEKKVGRVIFNSFPTGVEVTHAMVHGGPYPSTSDGRSTSVGSLAILRFARSVAYQGMPQFALPAELQDANPRQVPQLWNGELRLPSRD